MSVSTENFIKTIYQFSRDPGMNTRPGTVSKALDITQAATTDMARKLAGRGLLEYEKYRELRLTSLGEKEAVNVIRKHRLWETFLHRTLNMSLHEIHREAEMLEHQTSEFLASKIEEFLEHPSHDPHGDPIPDGKGVLETDILQIPLSGASPGSAYRIARLRGSGKSFFDFCQRNGLALDHPVEVLQQYTDPPMTEIRSGERILMLGEDLIHIIDVKPLYDENSHV